jgi:hypothetical protein
MRKIIDAFLFGGIREQLEIEIKGPGSFIEVIIFFVILV